MDEISKQNVSDLRQRIPVGIQHGLTLLEKTNGDIDLAETLFMEEVLQIVINKTVATKDLVQQHLIKNGYDISATLKSIEEESFTVSELICRRFENKREEALMKIGLAVEEQYHVRGERFWLDFKVLSDLPKEVSALLIIMEWLCFEEYEGFDIALSFELDIVTEQIENILGLSSLAVSLRQARDVGESAYKKNSAAGNIENYTKAAEEIKENKIYQKSEQHFKEQRPLIIDRLYEFVKENIEKYP